MLAILLTITLMLGIVLLITGKFVNFETLITKAIAKLRNWQATLRLTESRIGQKGSLGLDNVLELLILVLLGVILVFKFAPMIEDSSDTSNITNTTTKSFGDLAGWIVPALLFMGLIFLVVRKTMKWGKSSKG